MSVKHSRIAESLLKEAGIPYKIPTGGHYWIYKDPYSLEDFTKLIGYPKSNKLVEENPVGQPIITNKGTREDTVEYIKNWLKEGI